MISVAHPAAAGGVPPVVAPLQPAILILAVCHGLLATAGESTTVRWCVAGGGVVSALALTVMQIRASLASRNIVNIEEGGYLLNGGADKIEHVRTLARGSSGLPSVFPCAPSLTLLRLMVSIGICGLVISRLLNLSQAAVSSTVIACYVGVAIVFFAHRRVYRFDDGVLRIAEYDGSQVFSIYTIGLVGARFECDFEAKLACIQRDDQRVQIDLVAVRRPYEFLARIMREVPQDESRR